MCLWYVCDSEEVKKEYEVNPLSRWDRHMKHDRLGITCRHQKMIKLLLKYHIYSTSTQKNAREYKPHALNPTANPLMHSIKRGTMFTSSFTSASILSHFAGPFLAEVGYGTTDSLLAFAIKYHEAKREGLESKAYESIFGVSKKLLDRIIRSLIPNSIYFRKDSQNGEDIGWKRMKCVGGSGAWGNIFDSEEKGETRVKWLKKTQE